MSIPENFEFAQLWVFGLLPLPLLVYFLIPKFRTRSSHLNVSNFEKTQSYTNEKPKRAAQYQKRPLLAWIILLLVWVLLITSLATPRLVGEPQLKVKTARNFLILADISYSMARKDWVQGNNKSRRWDVVKSVLHDFIEKRNGDRMGLIFFGSSAYVQAPFTSDLNIVERMLEEADVGMAGQMTNIGKAIAKGTQMFEADTLETKVMLLLTDGVDAGMDILPLDAAGLTSQDSIIIYTIGIGDPSTGNSDLDESTLKQIAGLTNGKYFLGTNPKELESIYDELNQLEPIEFEEEEFVPSTLLYEYPLLIAIILILVFFILTTIIRFIQRIKSSSNNSNE